MTGARRGAVPRLDIDGIVTAAWALVERDGIDALSTRTLAAALGVRGPALYWHVASMQELLGLMIERALRDAIATPPGDLPWQEWLRAIAREQRRALLAHRDSGRIASGLSPSEAIRSELIPTIIAPLLAAGIERKDAVAATGALASFVLGWVIYEQRRETRDLIAALVDLDEAFEFGLDALIVGLVGKVALPSRGPGEAR